MLLWVNKQDTFFQEGPNAKQVFWEWPEGFCPSWASIKGGSVAALSSADASAHQPLDAFPSRRKQIWGLQLRVNLWEADEETNLTTFHIQRTSQQRKKEQKKKMANFILRKAEPKDVSDILRLIKVWNSVLNQIDAILKLCSYTAKIIFQSYK